MCVESKEWIKLGGKAFFCFTVSGFLRAKVIERAVNDCIESERNHWIADFGLGIPGSKAHSQCLHEIVIDGQ